MIDDSILDGRQPTLGTITLGRTKAREGKRPLPSKTKTACFHTNDGVVANAVLEQFGGTIHQDSENYKFDVEVKATDIPVLILPGTWRQWLEQWRAAECVRRCDGLNMITQNGRRLQEPQPCLCNPEARDCKPHSTLGVLIDLGVDRYAPWYVKSNAWGSASSLKGTLDSMRFAGLDGVIPGTLSTHLTKVRTPDDKVMEVAEFALSVSVALGDLPALRSGPAQSPLGAPAQTPSPVLTGEGDPSLPAGSDRPAPPLSAGSEDAGDAPDERATLLARWKQLGGELSDEELTALKGDWNRMFPNHGGTENLPLPLLRQWIVHVEGTRD